jgi:nitrate reductase beta subunit
LAVLQLFRAQRQILFRFKIEKGPKVAEVAVKMPSGETRVQELFNDTVIGFNKFGKEVVRVTIDEPVFQRPRAQHANSL